MDDEARQKVIDAIEQAFKMAGAQGFEDAATTIQKLSDFFLNHVKPLLSRKKLDELLQRAELSTEEEQMFIAMAESLPSLIAVALQMLSSEVAKSFPISNTGRPKALTSENQRALCSYIGGLHVQGTNLKIAKERAAQKFGVSVSTVERTWAERKKGHKPSLNELIGFLKNSNSIPS